MVWGIVLSSPSGNQGGRGGEPGLKRVLMHFDIEKKNKFCDDEFDIFIICLRRLGPQPPSGCTPSSVPLPQLSPSLLPFPIPLSLPSPLKSSQEIRGSPNSFSCIFRLKSPQLTFAPGSESSRERKFLGASRKFQELRSRERKFPGTKVPYHGTFAPGSESS